MPDPTDLLQAIPGASIPGALLGTARAVVGLINSDKAKKEAEKLARTRPKREISPLVGQNLSLAESELAGGMSTAAEKAYNNVLNQQLSGSLSAILRGGGDVNSVGDLFAKGEEGRQRLAMLNEELRLKQIDNVVKARNMMVDETDKNFLFNEVKPWEDKAAANAEARRSAEKSIWSGLDTLTGSASTFLGSKGKANSGTDSGDGGVSNYWLSEGAPLPRTTLPNIPASNGAAYSAPVPYNPGITPRPATPYSLPASAYEMPKYNQLFYSGG